MRRAESLASRVLQLGKSRRQSCGMRSRKTARPVAVMTMVGMLTRSLGGGLTRGIALFACVSACRQMKASRVAAAASDRRMMGWRATLRAGFFDALVCGVGVRRGAERRLAKLW